MIEQWFLDFFGKDLGAIFLSMLIVVIGVMVTLSIYVFFNKKI